jgi:hypothetical protein
MPTRQIPNTDVKYELIIYDAYGKERRDADGTFLSERVCTNAANASPPITDVFFSSHGWKGDVPAAIDQYDRWVGEVARLEIDRAAARERRLGFNPLIIGLHWPSLPFGDETIPAPGPGGVLSPEKPKHSIDGDVEEYASRIADTPVARKALRVILTASHSGASAQALTPQLRTAYETVFKESKLGASEVAGAPGKDQDGFDPDAIIRETADASAKAAAGTAAGATATPPSPGVLDSHILTSVKDILESPLQQMSFWQMKDRARAFGETGAHELLLKLMGVVPPATRFHLMGHSFGCIVVSATIAGPPWREPIPRPVHSLFLVQGALSLWSYAPDIPYRLGSPGYFNAILAKKLVQGPIITTRSSHDMAVGTYYPRGAQLKHQVVLAATTYPKYGGAGSFGAQGLDPSTVKDLVVQGPAGPYGFEFGRVYNVDADRIIKNGGPPSGAHSDIAHPEIAHVFWQGVLTAS